MQQPSFWDRETPAAPTALNIFLGLRPPGAVADRAERMASRLIEQHGLRCRTRPPRVLHVSLHGLWMAGREAAAFEAAARLALRRVAPPPFEVRFDRAASFSSRRKDGGGYPMVLLPDRASERRLCDLWQGLAHALDEALGGRARQFEPHMTLAYSRRRIEEQAVEPVTWRVDEVVLVHSLYGRTEHHVVDRRALPRSAWSDA